MPNILDPCSSFPLLMLSERVNLKRQPVLPRGAQTISTKDNAPQTMTPVPYETTI